MTLAIGRLEWEKPDCFFSREHTNPTAQPIPKGTETIHSVTSFGLISIPQSGTLKVTSSGCPKLIQNIPLTVKNR